MRTLRFIALLLTASCCAAANAEPLAHVDAFSKLKQGDTLVVLFYSRGCFNDSTFELTFRRALELAVSVVQLPRYAGGPTQSDRLDLGTLTLSNSDVAGLDRLMDFYRSKHDDFCTTVNHMTFTQLRDGKTVASEQITDGSCRTYRMKGLTRFSDLIGRLSSP